MAGFSQTSGSGEISGNFMLVRLTSTGALDTSFGNQGFVLTDFDQKADYGNTVLIQPDGKIVIAGSARVGGADDFAVARYNANGSPDDNGDGDGGDVGNFDIDPISNCVVYSADQEVDNRDELYSVPIAGGATVHLNPPLSRLIDFEINSQGQGVVFRAQPNGTKSIHLFMNPTAGGLLTPLTLPLGAYQYVAGHHISPDGAPTSTLYPVYLPIITR